LLPMCSILLLHVPTLIPKTVFKSELERISVEKWQKIWNQTTKGSITKAFFPRVEERLNMKLYIQTKSSPPF